MSGRFAVLGSGRQGVALAYGLAKNAGATRVSLLDVDALLATTAAERLRRMLPQTTCAIEAGPCDVTAESTVMEALAEVDVAISAVPYRFNLQLTQACIAAGVSLCDLGGNTDVVRAQLALHDEAARAGVAIVPDCGLAPGLGNILAAFGVTQLEEPRAAHVRCGGLPQERVGPLGYKLVFNFDGLINEYSGFGEFLRGGNRVLVPTLTELEPVELPDPLGTCEAAVTSGGTSTCAESFAGVLQEYDYKTIRYPGHFAIVRALFELGCFEPQVTFADGMTAAPRPLMEKLFAERLAYPRVRDLVVLRATVSGKHHGRETTLQFDLLDYHDEQTGLTAMERTTAFPTVLVAQLLAEGAIAAGARPLEQCLPLDDYVRRLADHEIHIAGLPE